MSSLPKPFKKLHPSIQELLIQLERNTPTEFQSKSIPIIKSGQNVFCNAVKGSGKTTTIVLTTLQKLKFEATGDAARAFVIVGSMEEATEVHSEFLKFTRYTSIRVYLAEEKAHVDLLKSEIFEGIDILIATVNTVDKLLLLNGINTRELKIFSIDNAEFLSDKKKMSQLLAVTNSIQKCQYIVYSEQPHPSLQKLKNYFMEYSSIVNC
ncbi:MAG: DEAD/DEAH box helicase [Flavicella sp.]